MCVSATSLHMLLARRGLRFCLATTQYFEALCVHISKCFSYVTANGLSGCDFGVSPLRQHNYHCELLLLVELRCWWYLRALMFVRRTTRLLRWLNW